MRKVKQLDICYNHDNDHGKHCSALSACVNQESYLNDINDIGEKIMSF